MSLDLALLLNDLGELLGVPPEQVAAAWRGESAGARLPDTEEIAALVRHSLGLIGMEVPLP